MKRALLMLLASASALADTVSLKFEGALAVDVVRAVYSDVLGKPVVIAPGALQNVERVTLVIPNIGRADVAAQADQIAARSGLSVEKFAGVVMIDKRLDAEDAGADFVYKPRFRSVPYLVDLLSTLFTSGAFSYQRGVKGQQAPSAKLADMKDGKMPVHQERVDTGGTAYSLMDKPPEVLIFRGSAGEVARLDKLLLQLDTQTPELLVKAMVYEVSTTDVDRSALSVAASLLGGKLNLKAGSGKVGDYSAVFRNASLSVIFDALSTDSRFKVVSQPQLRVSSGSSAKLMVGTQTPVAGAAQLDRNGNLIQSVEYKPSGVILDVRADVRGDVSQLTVDQQISQFSTTTTGVNSTPTLITRQLQTSVGMTGDEILVLGGLDEDKSDANSVGVSFLPSFLRSSSRAGSKTEILLFLQAHRL